MQYKKPLGTEDVLAEQIPLWRFVEETTRVTFESYGFSEIRTPIMESSVLFNRAVGEGTDVVDKEMYYLRTNEQSESKEPLVLRPELTAPVVRAYLEHSFDKVKKFQKLYYMGPLFRHERPQKGRLRQFHQIGIEAIGSDDYLIDVEVIDLAISYLSRLGISDCQLDLNTMGCGECRAAYTQALREQLKGQLDKLCPNCQVRYDKNILRILDCKNRQCYDICLKLEPLERYLCNNCREHFDRVKIGLDDNHIAYRLNKYLVRGLDYYTGTVFEIRHSALGAQDALCGGGRYNNLISQFGGPHTPAIGFAMGMERIIWTIQNAVKKELAPNGLVAYFIVLDPAYRIRAFKLCKNLRDNLISADIDYENKSVKAQFRNADRLKAKYVVILGPDELNRGALKVKEMATGAETEIKENLLLDCFKK